MKIAKVYSLLWIIVFTTSLYQYVITMIYIFCCYL